MTLTHFITGTVVEDQIPNTENNNTQKVVVMENPETFFDADSLSAVVNRNDENGISLSDEVQDSSEIDQFTNTSVNNTELNNSDEFVDNGGTDILLNCDEERVFNVTDSVTVQDAYLASVKMGHFKGLEEHAYFISNSPSKRSRNLSLSSPNKSPRTITRTSSLENCGYFSPEKTAAQKRRLSTEIFEMNSPKRQLLAAGNTRSPGLRNVQFCDEEDFIVHGSDTEGR